MIPTIVNNPTDNIEINNIPEVTTATITTFIPQINQTWETAIQQATIDGVPYSRTFSILSFPYTDNSLVKVDLGSYDPTYGASFYYLVINYFLETLYTSSINQTLPFNSWKKIETKFRQEQTYYHKQISQLVYHRPTVTITDSNDSSTIEYVTLPVGYSLTINAGKALGLIIQSVSPIQVYKVNGTTQTLVDPSFILLDVENIKVVFESITPTSHVTVTFTFYGEYQWSNQVPVDLGNEDVSLLHPFNTAYNDRLTPPGITGLPTSFWNSNLANAPTIDLTNRTGNPQWTS